MVRAMTRAPIRTAAARVGGHLSVPVDFGAGRGIVEYRFRPGLAAADASLADAIQSAATVDRVNLAVEFLLGRVVDEQRDDLRSAIESGDLDMATIPELMRAVIEAASGVDPTPPGSSSAG